MCLGFVWDLLEVTGLNGEDRGCVREISQVWLLAGSWIKVVFPICHFWSEYVLEMMHNWP